MSNIEELGHPKLDTLQVLANYGSRGCYANMIMKDLGLGFLDCYLHTNDLEDMKLISSSHFKFYITEKGREMLSAK
jgi:hypothetical protein